MTYLFIVMIAFGYVSGRLSASVSVTWRRIETFGTFYVWASFMLAAIGKSLEAPAYLPFVALLVASAIFRARAALSPAADRGAAAGRR